jgi:hypothetical protein
MQASWREWVPVQLGEDPSGSSLTGSSTQGGGPPGYPFGSMPGANPFAGVPGGPNAGYAPNTTAQFADEVVPAVPQHHVGPGPSAGGAWGAAPPQGYGAPQHMTLQFTGRRRRQTEKEPSCGQLLPVGRSVPCQLSPPVPMACPCRHDRSAVCHGEHELAAH